MSISRNCRRQLDVIGKHGSLVCAQCRGNDPASLLLVKGRILCANCTPGPGRSIYDYLIEREQFHHRVLAALADVYGKDNRYDLFLLAPLAEGLHRPGDSPTLYHYRAVASVLRTLGCQIRYTGGRARIRVPKALVTRIWALQQKSKEPVR